MLGLRRLGGRFKLLELAGRGAAGEVFRALDELTNDIVAVKCLSGRLEDDRAEERFAREVRILAAVSNPHVVRYVAHGRTEDDRPFVAVEWLEGEDLAKWLKNHAIDGPTVVDLVEQTASGLAALHAIGVVHRDVKPSNLFVSRTKEGRPHVRVIDLGVAYARGEPSLTRQGMMIGTPSYMSPEQILGDRALTARSDIFSLGVVLFQLVAGRKPYEGEDILAIVAKIALHDAPPLSSVAPTAPPELEAVVARALARKPVDRYPSITAFAEALGSVPPFEPHRVRNINAEATVAVRTSGTHESLSIAAAERRVVTAVFAKFARAEDSAAAARAFQSITERNGGSASSLLSLAHVAVFGGAHSTGDEARRAARTALALSNEIAGAALSIVTARVKSGVAGLSVDAIERAARAGATPASVGSIRVDEPTARLLGDAFEIGGSSNDMLLVGERSAEVARTFLGSAAPCVGRERELAQLEALYEEVCSEPVARAAIVLGAAGSGKSRVRRELLDKLASRDDAPVVLLGRATVLGEGAPFGTIGAAIRSHAAIRDDDPAVVQVAKLGRVVRSSDKNAILGDLARIAGVGGGAKSAVDDGVLVSDRLRAAFEAWLASLLESRPVAIVFEDVHWADAPSVTLVDAALRNLAERPLFVMAIARPELDARFPALWEARGAQTFRLAKLTKRASEALVKHALGDVDAAVKDGIVARADGNAFYLEELIRSIALAKAKGEDLASVALPDTVLGMVQARLDALGVEAKRLCKAASIFGESAWAGGVAYVLGAENATEEIDGELRALAEREVLERRASGRFSGEREYVFRHALLRDAAYELMLDEDRAAMHLRAGEWLEAHGEHDALVVARHFERGRAVDRAGPHLRRAAEQALYGSDFAAAIACAEQALSCGVSSETAGELLLLVAEARRWSGDLRAAENAASRASAELTKGTRAWFSAMRELVAAHGRLGNRDAIGPLADRVLDAEAEPGAAGAQIAALVPAAVHFLYGGDLERAEELARRIEALAAGAKDLEPRARARLHQLRAALATHTDDLEGAMAEQACALEAFETAGDQRAAALVRSNLSFALLQAGDLERAEVTLRGALAIAVRLGLESVRALALQNLGTVLAWQGRLDEAISTQSQAVSMFLAHADPRLEASSRVHLALARLAKGEIDLAVMEAARVVGGGPPTLEVGARAVLAQASLARGAAEAALAEAERALAVLEKLGSVEEFETYARLTLAEALEASGDREAARAALAKARERVEARRDKLRDPTLRASIVARIPEHARVFELSARAFGP